MTRAALRHGQRVLDAGCGVCGPARYFAAHRDLQIDAITISAVQAEMARARNIAAELDHRIHVAVGDFHRLTDVYPREQFDAVYFLESLSHSSRPGDALASVFEVLKPGGTVYVKDYFIRACDEAAEQARVLEVVARVDRLFATKTAWVADIRGAFTQAGFLPLWVARPQLEVDNARWQQFERRNAIDLFDGRPLLRLVRVVGDAVPEALNRCLHVPVQGVLQMPADNATVVKKAVEAFNQGQADGLNKCSATRWAGPRRIRRSRCGPRFPI